MCEVIKKSDGERCTRPAKKTNDDNKNVCTQHSKSKSPLTYIEQVEPWVTKRLPAPDDANSDKIRQRIRTALKKGPTTKQKGAGFIYVYQLEHERALGYYKIGSTERSLKERMDEWRREHKVKRLRVVESFYVDKNCRYIERLIHLYLSYCRLYRYPYTLKENGKCVQRMHSVWYSKPGVIIKDGQQIDDTAHHHKLVAKNKHIEWFFGVEATLLGVVRLLVQQL